MSSAFSERPYKSRLFNFISEQSHQITDRMRRAARHLKVAALWGGEILVYLVSAGVDKLRRTGKQVGGAAGTESPELPPRESGGDSARARLPKVAVDAPIQEVLKGAQLAEKSIGWIGILSPGFWVARLAGVGGGLAGGGRKNGIRDLRENSDRLLIQGIASLLETRSLVLVTADNQILNILTPGQQQKLQWLIRSQLSAVARCWRWLQASYQQAQVRIDGSSPKSAPKSALSSGMDLKQSNRLESVFGNSLAGEKALALAETPAQEENIAKENLESNLDESFWSALDSKVAEWEAPFAAEMAGVAEAGSLSDRQDKRFSCEDAQERSPQARPEEKALQKIQKFGVWLVSDWESEPNNGMGRRLNDGTQKIQTLIRAAIAYFFGPRSTSPLPEKNATLDLEGSEAASASGAMLGELSQPQQVNAALDLEGWQKAITAGALLRELKQTASPQPPTLPGEGAKGDGSESLGLNGDRANRPALGSQLPPGEGKSFGNLLRLLRDSKNLGKNSGKNLGKNPGKNPGKGRVKKARAMPKSDIAPAGSDGFLGNGAGARASNVLGDEEDPWLAPSGDRSGGITPGASDRTAPESKRELSLPKKSEIAAIFPPGQGTSQVRQRLSQLQKYKLEVPLLAEELPEQIGGEQIGGEQIGGEHIAKSGSDRKRTGKADPGEIAGLGVAEVGAAQNPGIPSTPVVERDPVAEQYPIATSSGTELETAAPRAIDKRATIEGDRSAEDLLEARVISSGYVKHPLEQVLEWLDRAVLWLEKKFPHQLLTKASRFFRRLLGLKDS